MAKKTKKAARRTVADTTASGSAAVCTGGELDAAAVVRQAAEVLLRAISGGLVNPEPIGAELQAIVRQEPPSGRGTGEENARFNSFVLQTQREFELNDTGETPYRRVVGKVVEVLTIHRRQVRRKDHCSVGDVFLVFLTEIPAHSPYDPDDYRLAKPTKRGNTFAVARDPGKTTIAGRLRDLKERGWLAPASTTRSGGERGYRLTENGRVLFDGWPVVEGLQLTAPSARE